MTGLAATQQWGAFRIGTHEFALPIEVLLEVAPCRALMALPEMPDFVRGGFDLRGTIVPVVDLRGRLGIAATNVDVELLVVARVGEHLVGIAVDAVTGTFAADVSAFQPLGSTAGVSALVTGCLQRSPGRLVCSMSAEALTAVPGMPLAPDRERHEHREAVDGTDADSQSEPFLLLRTGRLRFAVDALRVQSTLWEPKLLESVLAGGACRGEVEHRGRTVPAVELTALLGFGESTEPGATVARQAFVVQGDAGMLVLLVDHVAEIARVPSSATRALPEFAFPGAQLLRGVCRIGAGKGDGGEADHLVVDLEALLAREDVRVLAGMNGVPGRDQAAVGQVATAAASVSAELAAAANGRRLATFTLGGAFAVALEQLAEVLPCPRTPPAFGEDHMVRRILVHRDRSIPVVAMARLLVGEPHDVPEECVLVVACGDRWLGFAVPALKSLEPATWERPMPDSLRAVDGDLRGSGAERTMARLGTGQDHRIFEVLDLVAFAHRMLGGAANAVTDQPSMPSLAMSAAEATLATVPVGCA